ncbi:aldehyde dehydrogenase family protein, partial [Streptomyces sp. NPDC059083]|uniref:aldehyde dehydrogenase family protein n=1 Tax=Streptomyces sp. NPDC059083 TaxID=3346721 RepID=UPI0036A51273
MSTVSRTEAPLRNPDRFYIGGKWVEADSPAVIQVIDSATEEPYFTVAEAAAGDMDRAVGAARAAFDEGPWPRLTHMQRAEYLRALADGLRARTDDLAQLWTRQSGVLYSMAHGSVESVASVFDSYAGLADTYPFEQPMPSTVTAFGLLVHEPVGVVGAIVPWNGPLSILSYKIAPALIAGCSVVLKSSPEAPGDAYIVAEVAEAIGLPPGVLNVLTADREVSELLVRDPRIDKISFTGSTAAGRRIASLCGERIARCTLELGGKSAAVVLDDADLQSAADMLATSECRVTGQVCSSVTRVVVSRSRHDAMVEALAARFNG